jgi:hypothetical protein
MYKVEYAGRTTILDSPTPGSVAGHFECPAWTEPSPADKDRLIYDEVLTASGYRFVYGALGESGKKR